MRRTRFIALVLVVSIMLIGAGYAAWTDQIQVSNTVNTGNLNVYFNTSVGGELDLDDYTRGGVTYGNDTVGKYNVNDIATVTLHDLYPGAVTKINLKMKNNSTMPVMLDSDITSASDLVDALNITSPHGTNIIKYLAPEQIVIKYTNINNNTTTITASNAYTLTEAQKKIAAGSDITLSYNLRATDLIDQSTQYSVTLRPIFKQFNK